MTEVSRETSHESTFLQTFEETTPAVISNYRKLIEESKSESGKYHLFAALADTLLDAVEGAKQIIGEHEPLTLTGNTALEKAAQAIQERYWKGDLPISIEDAKRVCTEFAKAALRASGVKFRDEA